VHPEIALNLVLPIHGPMLHEARICVKCIITDEVVCFDILLQVLILKVDAGAVWRAVNLAQNLTVTGVVHTRFLSKSAEAIENKGREREKEAQESSLRGSGQVRVRKRKEGKEIEEVCSARFVRNNTDNGTIDLDVCQ
jgi:hypothetical protein